MVLRRKPKRRESSRAVVGFPLADRATVRSVPKPAGEKAVSVLLSCYRAEPYLATFLECAARQTIADQIEILLVHNDPTPGEEAVLRSFVREHPTMIRHLVVRPREPLPVSWNRGTRAAKGRYVAIWNVDDLRTPDSLERQLAVMEDDPNTIATYGDFVVVASHRSTSGRLVSTLPFDPKAFTLAFHGGCFPMWRRSAMDRVGSFDEQLEVVADFDFFVRLAFNGVMKKTDGLLGYYLDAGRGLSSRPDSRLYYERTLVERRYGMYGHIDYRFYLGSKSYCRDAMFFAGQRHPVELFVPGYREILRRRRASVPRGYLNFGTLMLRAAANKARHRLGL